jgi:hypothetical protein
VASDLLLFLQKITNIMKNSILLLILFVTSIGTLVAQNAEPSKNNSGVILTTNIFGFNDDLNSVNVGGGFYFNRKVTNRFSIYTEIDGSNRNYGNLSLQPGLVGEFTTGNVAIYIGPMFEIGKKMNLSLGLGENYLFNPELKTATGTIDINEETTNYSTLFFDIRKSIYKEVSLGIRYEYGLNSMFKTTDRKVTNISFNVFLPLRGKKYE